jgi:hypothetical protein
MDKLIIGVYDEATNSTIEREMTDEEQAIFIAANEEGFKAQGIDPFA